MNGEVDHETSVSPDNYDIQLRPFRVVVNLSKEQTPQAQICEHLGQENIRRTKWLRRKHIHWAFTILGFCASITVLVLVLSVNVDQQSTNNIPSHPPHTVSEADFSGSYEKAAERLLAHLNDEFDPCQDFYQFSCGNSGDNGSVFEQMGEDNLRDIKNLLESMKGDGEHEVNALKKVKQFYDSCMHDPASADNHTLVVLSTLESKIGQWPILQGAEWKESEHGLEKILAQLFAHEVQNIFQLRIIPNNTNSFALFFQSGKPAISGKFFLDRASVLYIYYYLYNQLLEDSVRILLRGKEWNLQVSLDIYYMLEFETSFARILESSKCALEGSEGFEKEVNAALNADITLGDIQEQLPMVNFTVLVRDIFNSLGVKGEVSNNMPVVLMCPEFFFKLVAALKLIDSRTVTNYLIWRFIFRYLPYMGGEFHNVWRMFAARVPLSIETAELPQDTRWEQCVRMANHEFGHAIAHMYVKQDYEKFKRAETIGKEISRYLVKAFRVVIMEKQWIGLRFKMLLIEKLTRTKITVGDPTYFESVGTLEQEYDGLEFNSCDFIQQILEIKRFKAAATIRKSLYLNYSRILESPVVVQAYHLGVSNEIVIPLGALRYPLFDESYPMYTHFANLGFTLAHELAHGFDSLGPYYGNQGKVSSWWPKDVEMSFTTRANCFADQYNKFKVPEVEDYLNGSHTLRENIADNTALRVSWLAYEMWAKDYIVERPLPGVNLSIPQIFYVTFGQMWCEVLDEEVYYVRYADDSHSPGMFRVLGATRNNAKFGKSFDCPAGSPMNPWRKCTLW